LLLRHFAPLRSKGGQAIQKFVYSEDAVAADEVAFDAASF
jgi:hypothetical protein